MSEHDQHHQHQKEHHDQARKEKKHNAIAHPGEGKPLMLPKILLIVGVVLTIAAVLIWTLV